MLSRTIARLPAHRPPPPGTPPASLVRLHAATPLDRTNAKASRAGHAPLHRDPRCVTPRAPRAFRAATLDHTHFAARRYTGCTPDTLKLVLQRVDGGHRLDERPAQLFRVAVCVTELDHQLVAQGACRLGDAAQARLALRGRGRRAPGRLGLRLGGLRRRPPLVQRRLCPGGVLPNQAPEVAQLAMLGQIAPSLDMTECIAPMGAVLRPSTVVLQRCHALQAYAYQG